MEIRSKIAPCLWFDGNAQEAARFYVEVFRNSRIVATSYYGEADREIHGKAPGSVLTVAFELEDQSFVALNGGPEFKFNEAISFQILCDDQRELDHYWDRLSAGGDPNVQQCGWLRDRFGVSWQVVPRVLPQMLVDPDPVKSQRAMAALMKMKKLDIAELERAFAG